MTPLSLYLHIPFCRHRCAYCDFNTYTTLGDLKESYTQALCREIAQAAALAKAVGQLRPVNTIFFGGGTPSLMPAPLLRQVVEQVEVSFGLLADAEVTLEANPETVDAHYLAALRRLGINRLSFGVQSVHADELSMLERGHDFATVVRVVEQARAAGFGNFNLDLIYGLPGQTLASWKATLEAALSLAPRHLSLYCLSIEPGTPMARWLRTGRITAPDPDLASEQYELATERLSSADLQHYEISNWARPGYECRHNLAYWRDEEYLGLGAGAHGHADGYRYAIVKQPRVYIRRMHEGQPQQYPLTAAVAEAHHLSETEAMGDAVMMQLRLLQEGLDLNAFARRFGQHLDTAFEGEVTRLVDLGLLQREDNRLRLSERGRFLSNQVFYRFM